MLHILLAFSVFYPSVFDSWNKAPLTGKEFFTPPAPLRLSARAAAAQTLLFGRLKDPALRSAVARQLAFADDTETVAALEKMLDSEKNAACRDDILASILKLADRGLLKNPDSKKYSAFFKSSSPVARATALRIHLKYAALPDFNAVFEALASETSQYVFNAAFEPMKKHSANFDRVKLASMASGKQVPARRAFALGLLAFSSPSPDLDPALANAFGANPPVADKAAVARGLAANPKGASDLLASLARDKNAPVRLCAARAANPSPRMEAILRRLASDETDAVREEVAKSLSAAQDPVSHELLCVLLADGSQSVRRAAMNSLIKLTPASKEIRAKAFAAASRNKDARHQVAVLFGSLKDRSCIPALTAMLDSAVGDDELEIKLAETLGTLAADGAAPSVGRLAASKNPSVRAAAAKFFGRISSKASYPFIRRLCSDRVELVRIAALASAALKKDRAFIPQFKSALATRSEGLADLRSIALHALASIAYKDASIMKNAAALALKECITAPLAQPMFDSDNVRISVLMYLRSFKEDAEAGILYAEIIKNVKDAARSTAENASPPSDGLLEFIRQIEEISKTGGCAPAPLPAQEPELAIKPL